VWHDSFICVTWLIHMCDMTHSYVWHDSFICVTWLIHISDMTHPYGWHDSFICATWPIADHQANGRVASRYIWHDSFISMAWLMHMRGVTRLHVWHDSFIYVTWLFADHQANHREASSSTCGSNARNGRGLYGCAHSAILEGGGDFFILSFIISFSRVEPPTSSPRTQGIGCMQREAGSAREERGERQIARECGICMCVHMCVCMYVCVHMCVYVYIWYIASTKCECVCVYRVRVYSEQDKHRS